MMKKILFLMLVLLFSTAVFAQTETMTNADIAALSQAGLGEQLLIQKIKTTDGSYDVSAKGLIELKKFGVADAVVAAVLEKAKVQPEKTSPVTSADGSTEPPKKALAPAEILRSARTIAIFKDSLNPSRQALEKELLKRPEWNKLNLRITEDKAAADLAVQIGFVPLSLITHRYVYRVYDRRSGLVIAAGETTSWGSLAENLAREITKKLDAVLQK